ncbi:MAG: ROK family protein [Kiritimatiellaeota bacterium]|nr:ROK family protein [Kiritimatiellota bacterium]
MKKARIGIDLGGTKIYAVVVDETDKVIGKAKSPTPSGATVADTAVVMLETAKAAAKLAGVRFSAFKNIGVAMPGAVTENSDLVFGAHNLGWNGVPAKAEFEKWFGKPVALGNDVNCGVLAEARLGAGKGAETVIGFFMGTGLGGGVVLNGKLLTGSHGLAGEFGHVIIRKNGRQCSCGHKGCLEAYASKVGMAAKFQELINNRGEKSLLTEYIAGDFSKLKSSALAKAYKAGDKVTMEVLDKAAYSLGLGAASVAAVIDPDRIVFGGGVIEALGKKLMSFIRKGFDEHLFALRPEQIELTVSELGDDAVALGATLL